MVRRGREGLQEEARYLRSSRDRLLSAFIGVHRRPIELIRPVLGFHQVCEDVADACQVTFALGFQPIENPRVETHTHCYLPPDVTQPRHARQLLSGQAGDVIEVNVRIVSSRLAYGSAGAHAAPRQSIACSRYLRRPRGRRSWSMRWGSSPMPLSFRATTQVDKT